MGEDLREGKPTVLFALAAEVVGRSSVLDRYGAADLSDDDIAALQEVLIESGAVERIEQRIDGLVAEAVVAMDRAPLTAEARRALSDLAYYVAGRDH